MPVKSLLLSLTLALSLTVQANVVTQAGQSLLEVITKKSEVESLLEKREIFAAGSESLETISNDFVLALRAFGIRGKNSHTKLLDSIKKINPTSDEDKKKVEELTALLMKRSSELTDDEISKVHNELLYLSSRYGKKGNVMLVCLDCTAASTITSKGYKYTFIELTDSKSQSIVKRLRTKGPKAVSRFIKEEMEAAKYGNFDTVSGSQISADQELAFALFLALGKEGNAFQKKYVQSVERVLGNNKDGSVNFFGSEYNHSLHMFFQENHEKGFIKDYTKFLNDIADAKEAKGLSSKEAYEEVLKSKALRKNDNGKLEEDPALMRKVNQLLGRCPMFK